MTAPAHKKPFWCSGCSRWLLRDPEAMARDRMSWCDRVGRPVRLSLKPPVADPPRSGALLP
jgi:hypothetical protein